MVNNTTRGLSMIPIYKPEGKTEHIKKVNERTHSHNVLMFTSMTVLMPFAVIIARHAKIFDCIGK